ncbi:MAG: hypothetical protein HUU15_14195 [Candidatus Brocadiae bacterium]|nr:hypothetical protein [Candidatus Brocadiia bacterium]
MRTALTPFLALVCSVSASAQDAVPKPSDKEAEAVIRDLRAALEKGTDVEKRDALVACIDCPHPKVAAAIAPVLVTGTAELRIGASQVLGRMPGLAEAAQALHAALKPNEKDEKTLQAMFAGIARVGHLSSVAVLRAWIDDRLDLRDSDEVPGVGYAFDALGYLKWKASVEAILDLVNKKKVSGEHAGSGGGYKQKVAKRAEAALVRLTGQEPFNDLELWKDWWKKHARDFNEDMTAREK